MNPATKRFTGRWNTSSGLPSCSMRPAHMTATRSPTVSASVWSWVTNRAGVRGAAQDVDDVGAQPGAQVRVEAGEGLVEQHSRGSGASARASATRWRSPPDSSCG